MLDDTGPVLRRRVGIQRNGDRAGAHHRKQQDRELDPVRRERDCDPLARAERLKPSTRYPARRSTWSATRRVGSSEAAAPPALIEGPGRLVFAFGGAKTHHQIVDDVALAIHASTLCPLDAGQHERILVGLLQALGDRIDGLFRKAPIDVAGDGLERGDAVIERPETEREIGVFLGGSSPPRRARLRARVGGGRGWRSSTGRARLPFRRRSNRARRNGPHSSPLASRR